MSNKSLISFVVLFGVAGSAIAADPCLPMQPPKVRNVAASQGVYDDYVHVFYDLTNPELSSFGADCNITLEFWPDPNDNWAKIYSGFPNIVHPNTALYIEWNNPNDWHGPGCKVRITAQEIKAPYFMGQAESGPFRLGEGQGAPRTTINGVTAKQRKDASKLVDIYYDLSADEPNYEYYVYVQISTDEGNTFDVNAVGVSGDVGARQQADKEKHIIWNPAIDLGAEASEPNCLVKVSVHGFADAVSEVFGIESVGPGDLFGAVYDSSTGDPIYNAKVSVYDSRNPLQPPSPQMRTTDLQGEFSVTGVTAGEKIIIVVVEAGYLPVWKTATIGEASRTWVNLATCQLGAVYKAAGTEVGASASKPVVVSVRGKYCGPDRYACYLDGISMQESFEVEINWHGNGSKEVHWITQTHPNGDPYIQTYIQPCSGDKVTRTFDMGNDIGEGSLEVMAVSQSGSESDRYRVNLDVAEPPPFLDKLIEVTSGILYIPVPTGEGFEYRILGLSGVNIGAGKFEGTTTTNIPIFNKAMEIGLKLEKQSIEEEKGGGSFSGRLSGMITSDGKAEMFSVGWDKEYKKETRKAIKGKEGLKLPFVKVSPRASVGFYFYWDRVNNKWVPGGAFGLGCNFLYSSPPYVVGAVLGVPIYLLAEVSLDLALNLGLTGWGPQWSGDFQFEPLGKGVLGAGIAKSVCVEGYLGGGFHSTVQFLPEGTWPGQWDKPYIVIVGGVRAQVGPFSAEMPMRHEWHNPSSSYNEFGPFQLLPREDYDDPDPCDFKGEILLAGGTEKPFPYRDGAVFPYSVPDVVRLDDSNMLAVWINDDTSRLEINRTKLTYATYDGHDWSEHKAVWDDGTADMSPQLISLGDGKAACIWQDARIELSDSDSLETFLSKMEIAVSFYDIHDGNWSEPTRLTDNDVLDRSPRIAAANANDMWAFWIKNEQNDIFGSWTASNTVMYSTYENVNGWSDATTIQYVSNTILDTTLSYNGTTATYVYCLAPHALKDQELYMLKYSVPGDIWSYTRLTGDDITDAAPKLAYDPNGDLLLFWVKGDNFNMARGTGGTIGPNDVARSTLVVRPGESMISEDFYPDVDPDTRMIGASMGVKDFDVVVDRETGQMALVWSDVSQPYIDPNLVDPNRLGPNLLDPNRIDPNRLDPNLIDLNLFPIGYDIWVSYRDPNFRCWSLPRQLTWDDAVERFVSGAFDLNGNLFCIYDKAQTDYNDVVEPFWTDNPSDPSFDPNFPKEVKVKGKPERGRSDLYYMSYRMGVDLSVAVEDLEIVPPNPLPGTEATIIAKIKNLGELPISNIKLDFLYVDPNIYSLGLDPNYWFLDPNDPNYIYADPNYYSIDPNYCFSEPNYSYLDPNNYVKLIYSLVVCEPNHVPGDFRVDRRVDIIDLAFFAGHWLSNCTVGNNRCDGTDLYMNDMNNTVNFRDFAILAKNWDTAAGPLCGGSEVEVTVPWPQLPEVPRVRSMIGGFWTDVNDFWRKIYVVVSSDEDEQGQRNTNNNTAGCETMRPDLTVSEMTVQTIESNDIITVRVANQGALKANAIKGGAVLRADNPNSGPDLESQDIPEIAAGAYYDVSFMVAQGYINEKAYAIVDPNETVEEFNEDNNIRSVTIRCE